MSAKSAANLLGITANESSAALERLERLGQLKRSNGKYMKSEKFITNFSDGFTAPALKELQRQILRKALDAIDLVSQDRKDITSMTMAIDPDLLPEAKNKIKKFRRELCTFLESGKRSQVFNLGIQLYPISVEFKSKEFSDD